jgi:polyphosphate kinase 2 (PPK2 family)
MKALPERGRIGIFNRSYYEDVLEVRVHPELLERRDKHWKFSSGDLEERKRWPEYQRAFEQMLQHTSTDWAPWWVAPGHKWVKRALVAAILTRSINALGVSFPTVSDERRRQLEAARQELLPNGKDKNARRAVAAKEPEE